MSSTSGILGDVQDSEKAAAVRADGVNSVVRSAGGLKRALRGAVAGILASAYGLLVGVAQAVFAPVIRFVDVLELFVALFRRLCFAFRRGLRRAACAATVKTA